MTELEFHVEIAGLELGHVVQVADEGVHTLDIGLDRAEEGLLLFIDLARDAAQQQVGVAFDRGHRRFQLMGHKTDELTLGVVSARQVDIELRVDQRDAGVLGQTLDKCQINQAEARLGIFLQDEQGIYVIALTSSAQ